MPLADEDTSSIDADVVDVGVLDCCSLSEESVLEFVRGCAI